jgi:hypothetical protein
MLTGPLQAAAYWRTSASAHPAAVSTVARVGRPSVSVPVLSTTSVSTFSKASRASASRIRTPRLAPRPTPTMIDMGVARPSAQGHAMMRTLTAATRPWARRGSGPQSDQAMKLRTAIAITAGTNTADTRSASRWIGARVRWASATMRTIWARRVSAPTRSARMTRPPVPLRVPPVTGSPAAFSTGMGSPLTIDSSTELLPSRTTPSTGTVSPGARAGGLRDVRRRGARPTRRHRGRFDARSSGRGRGGPEGAAGAAARPKLEDLSEQDEHGDDAAASK